MEDNNLINIWEQQKDVPDNEKLENKMITEYLKPKVSKVSWTFLFNLVFYIAALVASVIMLSMNIYGYRENPAMLTAESGLLVLSLIFLGYGVYIFMKIREINNYSKDLRELLKSKIRFLRFHYEIWLVITALVVWILTFALTTLVDNQDGFYRINRVGMFLTVSLGMIVFIYSIQKLSAGLSLRNLKVFLADLEESSMARTEQFEHRRKKSKWLYVAAFLILTLLLLLGLLKGLSLL